MSSSMCFGRGALAEYVVTGSDPSATATGILPSAASQSARPSLWTCQCMKVERESIFWRRYIPTLRTPVRGSFVITAGSVMNGAGSPGQQCWIGSASRSGSRTSSWQAPRETVFGIESARRLSFPRPLTFSTSPCGGCISITSSSFRATASRLSAPNARHMRLSVPNWLMSSGRSEPFTFLKRSAGPPPLTTRSVISVISRYGSTSASISTSSPSRRSRSIQERRSATATGSSLSLRPTASAGHVRRQAPGRSGRGVSSVAAAAAMRHPATELAEGDHAEEDEPDDEHRDDDVAALLGGRLLLRQKECEGQVAHARHPRWLIGKCGAGGGGRDRAWRRDRPQPLPGRDGLGTSGGAGDASRAASGGATGFGQ